MVQDIAERIEKDIHMFHESMEKLKGVALSEKERKVAGMAADYCRDAGSWLAKGDYYTSFASISYAHGLIDALLKTRP